MLIQTKLDLLQNLKQQQQMVYVNNTCIGAA